MRLKPYLAAYLQLYERPWARTTQLSHNQIPQPSPRMGENKYVQFELQSLGKIDYTAIDD
jgi:hypothetical protein